MEGVARDDGGRGVSVRYGTVQYCRNRGQDSGVLLLESRLIYKSLMTH